jgi:hypothetical protein
MWTGKFKKLDQFQFTTPGTLSLTSLWQNFSPAGFYIGSSTCLDEEESYQYDKISLK